MQEKQKINTDVSERIKQVIEHQSINNNVFAKHLGYSRSQTIYDVVNGKSLPSYDFFFRFENSEYSELFNIKWLITGKGDMLKTQTLSNNISDTIDTPAQTSGLNIVSSVKNTYSVQPTLIETVHPTVHPTLNLGMPKVVVVTADNKELVNLVSAKAAAGYLNGYADPEYVEKLPTISLPNLKGGTHRGFEVKGHSMNPTIHNGAIAVGRWVEYLEDIKENYVYIIVTKSDGIVVKRVLNRIIESGKLILKSENNNKREYPNILLDPEDVLEIWRLRGGFIFEFAEPNELNHRVNDLEAKMALMEDKYKKLL